MRIVEDVLIKPLITEKATEFADNANKYVFMVDKKANKLQIKNAVESMYGVTVDRVRTIILPAKEKVKYTKSGASVGRKPSYKKAIVSLLEGDSIDIFGAI